MEEMKKGLEEIRDQIADNDLFATDPAAQELLHSIAPVLENPGELDFSYHRSLMESLSHAAEKFEVAHPRLVNEIRVIINGLNDLGI